jgi:hypothetical protein
MSHSYEIEFDAPLPRSHQGRVSPEREALDRLAAAPIGASIRFPKEANRGSLLRSKAAAAAKGRWYSIRTDGPNHVRVWKIAEPKPASLKVAA